MTHINLIALVYFNCEEHIYLFNNEEQKYFCNLLDEIKTSKLLDVKNPETWFPVST